MSDQIPDDDLEALFARQRAADHEQAPAFHAMRTHGIESPPARASAPLPWRWALPAAAALGVAMVAQFTLHRRASAPAMSRDAVIREIEQIDVALRKSLAAQHDLTAWQSPTDFLLKPIQYETQ